MRQRIAGARLFRPLFVRPSQPSSNLLTSPRFVCPSERASARFVLLKCPPAVLPSFSPSNRIAAERSTYSTTFSARDFCMRIILASPRSWTDRRWFSSRWVASAHTRVPSIVRIRMNKWIRSPLRRPQRGILYAFFEHGASLVLQLSKMQGRV